MAGSQAGAWLAAAMEFTPLPDRIDTERLVLTPEEPGDAGWLTELINRRGAQRVTIEDSRARIAAMQAMTAEHGIGVLVLRTRTGEPLGYCGLVIGRASVPEPELAYELLPAARGRGLATEAARAVLDAAFGTGRARIWATVRPANTASLRVLDKLGFRRDHVSRDDAGQVVWLVADRPAGSGAGQGNRAVPLLVVVAGLPGTGKSAVAAGLAAQQRWVHVSIDPVEDALLGAGLPRGWATGVAAYEAARAAVEQNLVLGSSVVVDAVNDSEAARQTWRTAAAGTGALLVSVLLTLDDEAEHRRRLSGRSRGLASVPEPSWEEVRARAAAYEPWPEGSCLRLRADPPLPDVLRALTAALPSPR